MQRPQFRVKIIGGKLVQVPDFNYVQEHKQNGTKSVSNNTVTSGKKARKKHEDNASKLPLNDAYSMPKFGGPQKTSNAQPVSRKGETVLYNQRVSVQRQAEENRLRALKETYESVLTEEPIEQDSEDEFVENDKDDAALAKQIADCLQNCNKQKIAFALRAMRRLDTNGSGYITVREFRDVLLMYQVFIIGGTLEKLIEKYKSNGGKIYYSKLWSFVTKSYAGTQSSLPRKISPIHERFEGDEKFQEAFMRIERDLKIYAHRHHMTYDFTDITNSFENCDRGRSNLLGLKEMRIISKHYLPMDTESLEVVLEHCSHQNTSWTNYRDFLQILIGAQPTYLPPISTRRRDTYSLEDKEITRVTIDNNSFRNNENNRYTNNRHMQNNARALTQEIESNNDVLFQDNGTGYHDNELEFDNTHSNNSATNKDHPITSIKNPKRGIRPGTFKRSSPERDVFGNSPRRKWHESEESWRKRKVKTRSKGKIFRKHVQHSAPVGNTGESQDVGNTEDSEEWSNISCFI